MRVALVIEHFDAARGGAETSTFEMAGLLADAGEDVTVLTSGRPGVRTIGESPRAFRVEALAAVGWSRARRTRAFLEAAERRVSGGAFDVVHAVTPLRVADVYQPRGGTYLETIRRSVERGPSAGRLLRRLARGMNFRQRLLLRVERELLARRPPPVVAAVSRYVREQTLEAAPGFPPDRVRVVFNGVEIAPLSAREAAERRAAERGALRLGPDTPLAVLAAHNFRLKGVAELIRALAVSPKEIVAAIAGRDRAAPYERLARRLGVADRVRFLSPRRNMAALFAVADVLVHPTWYDPCSRVVLEALCCGLPVLTTRFNGAAEAIEEGRTGLVIDRPDNIPALAAALEAAFAPEIRAEARSRAAAERERLSMRRHVAELMGLYGEVTSGRRLRVAGQG